MIREKKIDSSKVIEMTIDQVTLLEKIIYIQACIIEGHDIRAILRKETPFFKTESEADVIIVCVENEDHVEIEYVLEENQHFLSLMRKYNLAPKEMSLNRFIEQCNSHFKLSNTHVAIESLYQIFEGTLSRKKTLAFEKEMGFHHGKLFPVHNKKGKKIGFVVYFFGEDSAVHEKKLIQLTEVFELLIRPFYDDDRRLLHGKCIQVDERMKRLTEKEKEITNKVLQGKPHKVIAEELNISINTLKTHMKNIFSKYGVNSKIELHNMLMGTS